MQAVTGWSDPPSRAPSLPGSARWPNISWWGSVRHHGPDDLGARTGRRPSVPAVPAGQGPAIRPSTLLDQVLGIDSGIRHAVAGSDYTSVRTGAFMGYRLIAELAGPKEVPRSKDGSLPIDDPRSSGFLANLSPAKFDHDFAPHLPTELAGINSGQFTAGPLTRSRGLIRTRPTRFASRRLVPFTKMHGCIGSRPCWRLIRTSRPSRNGRADVRLSCKLFGLRGLGSDGTDLLVELVREAGPAAGLYGAKITGGGSGGTVADPAEGADAGEARRGDRPPFSRGDWPRPYLFAGSSPGACHFRVGPVGQ